MSIFHSNLQLKSTRQTFDPAYQKILIVTEQIKLNPQIFSTFSGKKLYIITDILSSCFSKTA